MQEIVDASRKLNKSKLENQHKKKARKSKRDRKKSIPSLSSVAQMPEAEVFYCLSILNTSKYYGFMPELIQEKTSYN